MKDSSLPMGKHIKDKERYTVVAYNMRDCFFCGKPKTDIHEIFYGNANRQKSKDWGMCLPLCRECHRKVHASKAARLYTQYCGQKRFEQLYGHEKFMEVFKKDYICSRET